MIPHDELIDLLNENGAPLGRAEHWSVIHRRGHWHKAVHAWIVTPQGKLVIQKRFLNVKVYPGYWDMSAAGHILAGETSRTAAAKEIHEELGLEVQEKDFTLLCELKKQSVLNNGSYIDNEYIDVYLAILDINPSRLRINSEEVSEAKLLHYTELERLIREGKEKFVPHPEEYGKLFSELRSRFL